MAADFTTPAVTQTEANYALAIRDIASALAVMLDGVTTSNLPTGAIRWSSTNNRLEKFNGTTWATLCSLFDMNVMRLNGYQSTDFALVGHNHTGVYQPQDAELTAIAGLTSAADKAPYFTGSGAAALMTVTSVARTLLAASTQAAQRTALGLVIGTNVQAFDSTLAALAALTTAANKLIYATGSDAFATCDFPAQARTLLAATTAALQRTALGLGTAAIANTGAAAGNVPVLDSGGKLLSSIIPAGVGGVDTTARDNAAMTALLAQLSAGRATGPVPGGALYTLKTDELTNSGGTYDAAGDYYTNEGATTKITGITATADQEYSGYPASALVDGTANAWQSNNVTNQSITLTWASAKTVSRYDITPLSGWTTRAPQSWTVDVYKDGAWVAGVDARSGQTTWTNGVIKSFALAARQTGVTAIRFNLTGAQSGAVLYTITEIDVFDTAASTNMILTSAAVSLGKVPTKATVYLLHKAIDAAALGTDIKVSASRGDGWAEATDLGVLCQYDADYKLLRATVDLSALGTGSNAAWRVQTYNTKAQRVRAALLWAD